MFFFLITLIVLVPVQQPYKNETLQARQYRYILIK